MAQATRTKRTSNDSRNSNSNGNNRNSRPAGDDRATRGQSDKLTDSPMMAHLLDALEKGTDVGHYGRLVFAMVARHFLNEDKMISLLADQPEQDEESARALLQQVTARDYNPPRRERILEWQS